MVKIACVMMVVNEADRILVSLDSTKDWVDSYIFYDTGSSDGTQNIIRKWCEDNKREFHMLEGTFVDYSTSRNVLLDYSDEFNNDYNLLMESGDELKNGDELRRFCDNYTGESTGFFVRQLWGGENGVEIMYHNVRLIKTKRDWRYKGYVFEHIITPHLEHVLQSQVLDVTLYQDRRTVSRIHNYIQNKKFCDMLLDEYEHNPHDERNIFYLAQTFASLGNSQFAYKFYEMRSKMTGYKEEIFHSLMRCGDLREDSDGKIDFYKKALAVLHLKRVEPLLCLVEIYKQRNMWHEAFEHAQEALSLNFPIECRLFTDKQAYDYKRWHIFYVVTFYYVKNGGDTSLMTSAINACDKAISAQYYGVDMVNRGYLTNERDGELKTKEEYEKEVRKVLFCYNGHQDGTGEIIISYIV